MDQKDRFFISFLLFLLAIMVYAGTMVISTKLDRVIELLNPQEIEETEELSIEDLETGPPMLMIG